MTRKALTGEQRVALAGLAVTVAITAAWWALAFWPVDDSAAWLTRTRYVCFGVSANGLPDAGGWIGLIAGPIGMLGIVLVGWGRGVRALLRGARHSLSLASVLTALVLITLLIATGAILRVQQASAAQSFADDPIDNDVSSWPRLDKRAPALELIAHDGVTRSLEQMRGRPVLLTFAYAHCSTICPLLIHDVLAAQKLVRNAGIKPVVLVVTIDPWRDTPSRLAHAALQWQFPATDAWLLGGSVHDVEAVLEAWDVPITRNLQTGAVTHPPLVYVIDARGRIAFAALGGADALANLLRRLAGGA